MTAEKPGGHGERSVAVGTIDMAVWDAVSKIEEFRSIACSRIDTTAASPGASLGVRRRRLLLPGKGLDALQDEMLAYRDLGYEVVKMKIGGVPLADDLKRIEAVLDIVGDGRISRWTPTAVSTCRPPSPTGMPWRRIVSSGTKRLAIRSISPSRPSSPNATLTHGHRRKSLLHAGRPQPDSLRRYAPRNRLAPVRLRALLRPGRISAHIRWSKQTAGPAAASFPRRPPDVAQMAAGLGLGGNESYPGVFQPFGGFADGIRDRTAKSAFPVARIGFEEKGGLIEMMRRAAAGESAAD